MARQGRSAHPRANLPVAKSQTSTDPDHAGASEEAKTGRQSNGHRDTQRHMHKPVQPGCGHTCVPAGLCMCPQAPQGPPSIPWALTSRMVMGQWGARSHDGIPTGAADRLLTAALGGQWRGGCQGESSRRWKAPHTRLGPPSLLTHIPGRPWLCTGRWGRGWPPQGHTFSSGILPAPYCSVSPNNVGRFDE